MSSSNGFGKKLRSRPSIQSLDSGYDTGALEDIESSSGEFYLQSNTSASELQQHLDFEENAGLGLDFDFATFLHGDDESQTMKEEVPVQPTVTPHNFLASEYTDHASFLPEIPSKGCLTCELWNITNPGETLRCHDCRIPETVEPMMLCPNSNWRGPETSVTPLQILTATIQNNHRRPDLPGPSTRTRRCTACGLSSLIDCSNPSSCPTCSAPDTKLLSPLSPLSPTSPRLLRHKIRRSRAGKNTKLPLSALTRLQAWLEAHQDNPYPSADEKRQLALDSGITEKQVATWFTNARARQLNPLDTWLSSRSGSDDDGAQESDIASAARTPTYDMSGLVYMDPGYGGNGTTNNLSNTFSTKTPTTPAQLGTVYNRRAASVSGSSAFSAPQASRRGKKKNYRMRATQTPQITGLLSPTAISPTHPNPNPTSPHHQHEQENPELWQCTFCGTPLVPKSWRRHEETQHRPRSRWTCMLDGPRLPVPAPNPSSASTCCAFCLAQDPSDEHFALHRVAECAKRPLAERTFFRPDHLRQHVQNFHSAQLFDGAQTRWKRGPAASESRAAKEGSTGRERGREKKKKAGQEEEEWTCGFCGEALNSWGLRESHIAGHFKEGLRMDRWKSDWASPSVRAEEHGFAERGGEMVMEKGRGEGVDGFEQRDGREFMFSRQRDRLARSENADENHHFNSRLAMERTVPRQQHHRQHQEIYQQLPPHQHQQQRHQHQHHHHQQQHSAFAIAFSPTPTSTPAISMPMSMCMQPSAFPTPSTLSGINTNPPMSNIPPSSYGIPMPAMSMPPTSTSTMADFANETFDWTPAGTDVTNHMPLYASASGDDGGAMAYYDTAGFDFGGQVWNGGSVDWRGEGGNGGWGDGRGA